MYAQCYGPAKVAKVGYRSRSCAGLLVTACSDCADAGEGSRIINGTRVDESHNVILHHVLCSPKFWPWSLHTAITVSSDKPRRLTASSILPTWLST